MKGLIGTEIILNKYEKKIAEVIGKARHMNNRRLGVKNRIIAKKQDPIFLDKNSMGGELAFGKLFNLYPDFEIGVHPDFDYILNGETVDVKATEYDFGKLLTYSRKLDMNKTCDLYALMTGDLYKEENRAIYTFRGFMRREDYFIDEMIEDISGWGKGYAARQDNLYEVYVIENGITKLYTKSPDNYDKKEEDDFLERLGEQMND